MDPVWRFLPEDLVWKIVDHLDAGTRRDLGRPPRKLDLEPWQDFQPRGFEEELFVYYYNEKKLVYYETGKYNYFYYEIITNIKPSHHEHEWIVQEGSRTRGTMHCDESSETYDVKTKGYYFHTAGWPVFVSKNVSCEGQGLDMIG